MEGFLVSESMYLTAKSAMNDFNKRFDIEVDMEEARKKFTNRVYNEIFDNLPCSRIFSDQSFSENQITSYQSSVRPIVSALGKEYKPWGATPETRLRYYIDSFYDVLEAVEAIYSIESKKDVNDYWEKISPQERLDEKIRNILTQSELDIGIRWQDGKFWPKGAELLDDKLVNDPLKWLRDRGYSTVTDPFEKALRHFIEAGSRPELLSDAIGNSYIALEALAKIVVGNNSDLSTNKKPFVKRLNGNNFHEQIFKVLEKYLYAGNPYRHGDNLEKPLPELTHAETEFFLYLTGTFIRLAMENWESS